MKDRHRYIALENNFPDHPKTLEIGPLAAYLYICGLCYCDRHLTDGFIPRQSLLSISGMLEYEIEANHDLVRLLESCYMWIRVEENGEFVGWNVHDYLGHQLSKQALASLSEKRAQAGRKGGLAAAKKRNTQPSKRQANASKPSKGQAEEEVEVHKEQGPFIASYESKGQGENDLDQELLTTFATDRPDA